MKSKKEIECKLIDLKELSKLYANDDNIYIIDHHEVIIDKIKLLEWVLEESLTCKTLSDFDDEDFNLATTF